MRLQIAQLPEVTIGEVSRREFIIVLDEVDLDLTEALANEAEGIKDASGARAIFAFHDRVEVVGSEPIEVPSVEHVATLGPEVFA